MIDTRAQRESLHVLQSELGRSDCVSVDAGVGRVRVDGVVVGVSG